MDDAGLVRQALAGESTAYEQLVRRWAARVLAVCHARVRRADVAEELAQETLVRGWQALRTISEPERVGAWLCGIATRVCLDWLKSSHRSEVTFSAMEKGDDDHARRNWRPRGMPRTTQSIATRCAASSAKSNGCRTSTGRSS